MDIDTPVANIPEGLTRAEGLWFADCGLIIQAENTLFRVSRDILAIQSSVFQGMISLPAPREQDTMDGCPFVRLPDSAEDIAAFLRAIFYYDFFEPFPAPTTFPILSSILRMSHKYEVDMLRKRALLHLSSAHPTTLDEWERLQSGVPSWKSERGNEDQNLAIVALAGQVGATWILPTAFYRMCQTSDERCIITGSQLSDLGKADFFKGLRFLETSGAADVLRFLQSPSPDCPDHVSCMLLQQKRYHWVAVRGHYDEDAAGSMPLELWRKNDWNHLVECEECLPLMQKMHTAARERLWNNLPEIFKLPKWTELEETKAEALK
ncbi:hypothetical protein DFH06DRAFT_1198614 [Mycena polygramma]|nr:hypothetical protein DFH06DRAFT_1198614 [Mycena polygramma]